MIEEKYKQCWGCHTNFLQQENLEAYALAGIARYGVMSPECAQVSCRVLNKEREWAGYPPIHRLLIDAGAACHPPHLEIQQKLDIEPRLIRASIQSIGIHLIALYLAFEKNITLLEISDYMRKILDSGIKLEELKLTPPSNFGSMSILDLDQATTFQEYEKLAEQWARLVWESWSAHHATIAQICKPFVR
jgi:hypothetical protein